jgi:hypothetical protein
MRAKILGLHHGISSRMGWNVFFSPMKWAVVSAILIYVVDSTFYSNALK